MGLIPTQKRKPFRFISYQRFLRARNFCNLRVKLEHVKPPPGNRVKLAETFFYAYMKVYKIFFAKKEQILRIFL